METNITAKSGTKPVQKSNDDFWVGDGAGQECCNHADRVLLWVMMFLKQSLQ